MDLTITNKFMKDEDCDKIISFIENNLNLFNTGKYKLAHRLLFGIDYWHGESIPEIRDIDPIKEIIINYFNKIIDHTKNKYGLFEKYYISSFWLARQIEGAFLDLHGDTDNNKNQQLEYSCGIYLNDVKLDGELYFPKLEYSYQPKKGDLVSWPSKDSIYDHEVNKITDTRYTMLVWLTTDPRYSLIDL